MIEPELVAALADDLDRLERFYGVVPSDNGFEGTKTVRIYNLLALAKLYETIPVHERAAVVERVLDRRVPGLVAVVDRHRRRRERAADPRRRSAHPAHEAARRRCATRCGRSPTSPRRTATRLIPGSHLRDHSPDFGAPYDRSRPRCRRGSVLVWHGSLWHGGGANRTDDASRHRDELLRRLDPPAGEPAARHPPRGGGGLLARLRQLCGYGVYNGLIGHIDKHSPVEMLGEPPAEDQMVWDAV